MAQDCLGCFNLDPKRISSHDILRQRKMTLAELQAYAVGGCPKCELLRRAAMLFRTKLTSSDIETMLYINSGEYFDILLVDIRIGHLSPVSIVYLSILASTPFEIPWDGFKVRSLPCPESSSDECLALVKSWIRTCVDSHEHCNTSRGVRSQGLETPKRILRISKKDDNSLSLKLQDFPETSCNFIALSYCWGDPAKVVKTTNETLQKHRDVGVEQEHLPKTFLDAINLTSKLGLEYIWIDSLCILQGDSDDFDEEAPKMGDIYAGAFLVLSAASARDVTEGLHVARETSQAVAFITRTGREIKAHVLANRTHGVWQITSNWRNVDELPLFSRAWAFQERLQATRIIHFTDFELVWECKCCVRCECGELETLYQPRIWQAWEAGVNLKGVFDEVVSRGGVEDRLSLWRHMTMNYGPKRLTQSSDRLPALSSLARRIGLDNSLGSYYAGIWENTMPGSLLWMSSVPYDTWIDKKPTHSRISSSSVPSWSWMSIQGHVYTPRTLREDVKFEIRNISYELTTADKYGPCKNARITIYGAISPVNIDRKIDRSSLVAKYKVKSASLDLIGLTWDTRPFEYDMEALQNKEIIALLSDDDGGIDVTCIILLRCSPDEFVYKRIGFARFAPRECFDNAEMRQLDLI